MIIASLTDLPREGESNGLVIITTIVCSVSCASSLDREQTTCHHCHTYDVLTIRKLCNVPERHSHRQYSKYMVWFKNSHQADQLSKFTHNSVRPNDPAIDKPVHK